MNPLAIPTPRVKHQAARGSFEVLTLGSTLGNGSGTDFGASQCIPMGPCRWRWRYRLTLGVFIPLEIVVFVYSFVVFSHSLISFLRNGSLRNKVHLVWAINCWLWSERVSGLRRKNLQTAKKSLFIVVYWESVLYLTIWRNKHSSDPKGRLSRWNSFASY